MVAINFSHRFAGYVEHGVKRQTIRGLDHPAVAGCSIQLYTGQRTKSCRKLGDTICKSVQTIILMERLAQPHGNVALIGVYLEEFAHADGFACYADMWDFFKYRANAEGEYHGKLIKW